MVDGNIMKHTCSYRFQEVGKFNAHKSLQILVKRCRRTLNSNRFLNSMTYKYFNDSCRESVNTEISMAGTCATYFMGCVSDVEKTLVTILPFGVAL